MAVDYKNNRKYKYRNKYFLKKHNNLIWDAVMNTKFIFLTFLLGVLAGCGGGGDGGGGGNADKTAPVSTIIFPTGGEVLSGTIDITWNTVDANPGVVDIALSNNSGASYTTIATNEPDDGSYSLDTTLLSSQFNPDQASTFRVRITPRDIPSNLGQSVVSSDFTIDNTPPTVTLDAPSGGEIIGGSAVSIEWTSTDDNLDRVKIEVTQDGGATYSTVETGVPDTGSYNWDTTGLTDGSTYNVRVTAIDAAQNSSTASSDTDFTIDNTVPVTNILFPVGNEILAGLLDLTWETAEAHKGTVKIEVSNDGGNNYTVLAATEADDGLYSVNTQTLSLTPKQGDSFRFRITPVDIAGNIGNSSETQNFSVDNTPPIVTLTAPSDGAIVGGISETISWTTDDANPGTVNIMLSEDGGSTFPVQLASAIPDTGSFSWDTTSVVDGVNYRVLVEAVDAAGLSSGSTNNSNLSIDNTPPIVENSSLSFADAIQNGATIGWNSATDSPVPSSILEYRLFYSNSANLDSVTNTQANGIAVGDWSPNLSVQNVTNVTGAHDMYWNVLVRDSVGNIASYNQTLPFGILDYTFDSDGVVFHDNAAGGSHSDRGKAVAVDSLGRIIAVGYSRNSALSVESVVWRYLPDGTLDTTFGNDYDADGTPDGYVSYQGVAGGTTWDEPNAVVIAPDNKIIVVGYAWDSNLDWKMYVIRYNTDGSFDTSFGVDYDANNVPDGFVNYGSPAGVGFDAAGNDIAIDASVIPYQIIVAGYMSNGVDIDMAVWRLNNNGLLDTSFGGNYDGIPGNDGYFIHDNAAGGAANDYATGVVIDSSGRILVSGTSDQGVEYNSTVIWRLTSSGALDTSFGGDYDGLVGRDGYVIGERSDGIRPDSPANDIALDGNKIVVTGGISSVLLWRFDENGDLDVTFGEDFSGDGTLDGWSSTSALNGGVALVIDTSKNIYVVERSANTDDVTLFRFTSDGLIDPSFNLDGKIINNSSLNGTGNDDAYGLTIDNNGKVIMIGSSTQTNFDDMALWRIK